MCSKGGVFAPTMDGNMIATGPLGEWSIKRGVHQTSGPSVDRSTKKVVHQASGPPSKHEKAAAELQ